MGAKLCVNAPAREPFEVPIGNTATIGRTRENTVCLNFCPQASRQHALVRCHNAYQYQIIDLGSRNGTYVNNHRVITPITLENGAKIRIGTTEIVFEEDDTLGEGEELEMTLAATMDTSAPHIQTVAILVCDIRGFSSMAERISEGDLAHVLGAWFREAGNIVQSAGGTIDKFIGDAVLAYWPHRSGTSAECETVLDVCTKLLDLAGGMTWPAPDAAFNVGIAVHWGRVTLSNIGLVAQRDATIIGDAVNTAFRLESVMKEVGESVLVSADFVAALGTPGRFRDLGEHQLKGKAQAVRVFGLALAAP